MNWPIFFRLNERYLTFHLRYKHSGTFAKRKYEELSYTKKAENVTPWLIPLLKMRPHHSQPSCENATPTSGASPLASYKEVRPPPPAPRRPWSRRYFTRGFGVPITLHLNYQIRLKTVLNYSLIVHQSKIKYKFSWIESRGLLTPCGFFERDGD